MQQNIAPYILTERQKLLMRMILIMHLNQSITRLYQTYKIKWKKFGLGY